MKNNLKIAGVLIAGVLLVGCESRSFKAEREIFRASKMAEAVFKNPKGTPPFQFQQVIDAYRKIGQKYPNTLLTAEAEMSIGRLYVVKGDFEKARQTYKALETDCDKKGNLCAEVDYAIGISYEVEQNWPSALTQYQHILTAYPLSSKSLELPLYFIRHYRAAKDIENTKRFVDEAVAHYLDLKSKVKADKGGFVLQGLVTRSYIEGAQWQDALDSLDKLVRDYPKFNPEESLWIKALIYHRQMKDTLRSKQELQKIIADYPHSKLAKQAEILVKKL